MKTLSQKNQILTIFGLFLQKWLIFLGCDHLISVCSELHNWMHNMQVLFRKEKNFPKNQILTIFGQFFAKMANFIFENGFFIHLKSELHNQMHNMQRLLINKK